MSRPGPFILLPLLAVVLALAACSGDPSTITGSIDDGTTPTTTAPTADPGPVAATSSTAATSVPTTAPTAGPPCVTGNVPFTTADGVAAAFGDATGDAAAISGLRWSIEDACERFVIDLSTANGSPASTVGRTTVSLQAGRGIVRIELPAGVDASSIADTVVDGEMITAAYVVELLSGTLAVDLHLSTSGAVAVRAFPAVSPVRIVVDLRSDGSGPAATPPAVVGDLVLVTPRDGPADYPLDVSGYVRDDTVDLQVFLAPESPDRIPGEVAIAGSDGTWSEFRTVYEDGPAGTVELQAATKSGTTEVDVIRVLLALE